MLIQRGEFIGGAGHPEMGHYYVAQHPMDVEKKIQGVCPFHNGCLEGFAAGPSLKLVQVFVGRSLNSTAMYGIFKPTTSHKLQ